MEMKSREKLKTVFLKTIKTYQNEGKAVLTPIVSNDDEPQEYIGTIKSGKSIYFAFVDNNENSCNINSLKLSSFIDKAKIFFNLGGIVFAILCIYGKTYRVPHFVLESIACKDYIDESAIETFKFETNDEIMDFFQKDIFECTIAGKMMHSFAK